jgi:hypothetical protein
LKWKVRDGLVALIEELKADALETYRHEQMMYVQGGLTERPTVPDILKE